MREVAVRESNAFLESYFAAQSQINWLNSPSAIDSCASKPRQLLVARAIGISVPEWLITNDEKQAKDFIKEQRLCIVKSLACGFIEYGKRKRLKFFTQAVPDDPSPLYDSMHTAPCFLQQRIKSVAELRVTVVGNEVFSIGIKTDDLPINSPDVREIDYESERHRFFKAQITDEIATWSLAITKHFGLGYAGLDWLIDRNGKIWFLEINACGSFLWFEMMGAGPISDSIASSLLSMAL